MNDEIKNKELTELEEVKNQLEEAKVKCEEYLAGWQRERADFMNYKKDEMERIGQLVKYSNEELILKIIPILDNIYLAESHIPDELKGDNPSTGSGRATKSWLEGFNAIKNQLCDFLKKEGIEPVDAVGKKFDPNTMEAVDEADFAKSDFAKSEVVEGEVNDDRTLVEAEMVAEEVQRGYTMHGKLIRVARVRVGK